MMTAVSTSSTSPRAGLGYEEPVYRGFKKQNDDTGEGLYRRTFMMPREMAGRRVLLHFGGVWVSAEVWVNGEWIGRHDSGYTSFTMDVSKAVKAGRENVLAMRVRQVCPGYQTDTYDDWTLGGIYRDVTLESMPAKRRIDRVRVESKTTGEVKVKVMVADTHKNTLPGNYMSPGEPYQLRITLTDADGKEVAWQTVSVKGHPANSRETDVMLNVKDAHLWTAETPYLYTLRTELIDEENHTITQKVGIREISTKDSVLRINGQAVKLRGVNRHDEHPDVGRAVTREHWLQDLRLMKEANINYIRACHYQHAKGFIEMCDSMGFYVGSEVGSLKESERTMVRKGQIGFVFQSFNLIDELNVEQNVELPLKYLGVPKKERQERVVEMLRRMGISHRTKHYPNQLSGGQQQRVAIARAVVTKPKLIFADEPTGNLDSKNGFEVMELLKQLNS